MDSSRDIFRPYVQDLERTVGTEWKEADDPPSDLGFGSKVADQARVRLLNRDGTFNVERKGLSFFKSLNLYHTLLSMSWWNFTLTAFVVYVVVNLSFATAFVLCGPEALAGSTATTWVGRLAEAFFFSVQTFTSVGYGALSPNLLVANVIATIDAFAGLLFFALVAGLVFARFAQPQPQIAFSERAIIAPYRDRSALEFSIANQRQSQLIEVEAKVVLRLYASSGQRAAGSLLSASAGAGSGVVLSAALDGRPSDRRVEPAARVYGRRSPRDGGRSLDSTYGHRRGLVAGRAHAVVVPVR